MKEHNKGEKYWKQGKYGGLGEVIFKEAKNKILGCRVIKSIIGNFPSLKNYLRMGNNSFLGSTLNFKKLLYLVKGWLIGQKFGRLLRFGSNRNFV